MDESYNVINTFILFKLNTLPFVSCLPPALHIYTHTQIGHKNRLDEKKPLSVEEVVSIMKDIFVVATERDIYTGDSVEIKVIKKDGITTEIFPLKTD